LIPHEYLVHHYDTVLVCVKILVCMCAEVRMIPIGNETVLSAHH